MRLSMLVRLSFGPPVTIGRGCRLARRRRSRRFIRWMRSVVGRPPYGGQHVWAYARDAIDCRTTQAAGADTV